MLQAEQDALVILAQGGDERALSLLYETITPALTRFAFHLLQEPADASDVVQQVWLNAVRDLSRIRDPRVFRSWLYRAVRWQCQDRTRRNMSRDAALDAIEKDSQELPPSTEPPVDGDPGILSFIQRLPQAEREAVYMFYQSGLSIEDIAMIQGTPTGTTKSRLNRARHRLKQWWEQHYES